jgi:hypothetical protein
MKQRIMKEKISILLQILYALLMQRCTEVAFIALI